MKNFPCTRFLRLIGCVFLWVLVGINTAAAQAPVDKGVLKIVVPFGPGSSSDVIARAFGKAVTEVSGLSVIVENKPGADTVIGIQSVLNAPADGSTLLLVSSSTTVLNPLMVPNQPFDMLRDFVPLVAIARNSPAFNVGPSTHFKSVREFVAAAKASPGKYTYGSATTTSLLAGQMLEARTGIEMLNVPYKTTAAAVTALAAGEVDLVLVDPATVKGLSEGGRIRSLAIGAPARLAGLPQVPTMAEEGVPDYQITSWFATYFKAHTPAQKVTAMREILRKAVKAPSYTEALKKANLETHDLIGDEITALTRSEIEMFGKIIRPAKVSPPPK
ncbi:tripartite tricarboxylate transporter substrate binding protein [Variovorax guangxiensis]|uniref:Bug family tripartite tricarboxylate transporter substrate binding protein n=1 Tax=Variovorax guangxiensis TaxID=1775474 RepID=UPI002865E1FC|nr:tripartite tricarboxylate transporter substrate binding protein [Variovorax guangxiensis]MDR6858768.1 tripartite-type tricarboxylate transporter receptor subunit TctC [Variovorax guangxiensis]